MNDQPSKMPHDQNKKRLRSLRPQLEQLDPRLCFSIDLPEPLAVFPGTELTAEISVPVDSNAVLQSELDTASNRLHVDELIDETNPNDSTDVDSTIDFDVGSWMESNEDDEQNEEDPPIGVVTAALSGPAEAGRMEISGFLPEPSVDEVFTEDMVSETPFEVWEDNPLQPDVSPLEQNGNRQPWPLPIPPIQQANSMATNSTSLPLIQPVANLSLQSRPAANDMVARRDISSFVGSQNDSLGDDHSVAPNQIAHSKRESQPDSEFIRTDVASRELKSTVTRDEQQTTRKHPLDAENSSLPLVMEVATIDLERAKSLEQVAANTWLVSTEDIPSLQHVSLVGLVSLGNTPSRQRLSPDRPYDLRVIPAEQGGVPLSGVFESVSSNDSPASTEDNGTTLSENTYRLLLAGLIAIPTSTRGKKVIRWFQRDKKRDE